MNIRWLSYMCRGRRRRKSLGDGISESLRGCRKPVIWRALCLLGERKRPRSVHGWRGIIQVGHSALQLCGRGARVILRILFRHG